MKRSNKGITLVALVITIIVLIILAAVSINAVMNGGIIQNAKDARDEFDKAKISEEQMLKATEMEMHELAGTYPTETDEKYFIFDENDKSKLKGFNSEIEGAPSDVVIPNTITGLWADSEESGEPGGVFKYCNTITSVVIPGSIKDIGYLEFTRCENLKNVYMFEGVERIGEHSFDGCTSLENIVLPSSITYIGTWAFVGCSSLENVVIQNGLEVLGGEAFSNCTRLKTIEFKGTVAPDIDRTYSSDLVGPFTSTPLEKVYIPQGTTAAYTQALGESKCGPNNDVLVSSLLEER